MKDKTEEMLETTEQQDCEALLHSCLASVHLVVFIWVAFVCVVLGVLYGERPWTSVKSVQFFVFQFLLFGAAFLGLVVKNGCSKPP